MDRDPCSYMPVSLPFSMTFLLVCYVLASNCPAGLCSIPQGPFLSPSRSRHPSDSVQSPKQKWKFTPRVSGGQETIVFSYMLKIQNRCQLNKSCSLTLLSNLSQDFLHFIYFAIVPQACSLTPHVMPAGCLLLSEAERKKRVRKSMFQA